MFIMIYLLYNLNQLQLVKVCIIGKKSILYNDKL